MTYKSWNRRQVIEEFTRLAQMYEETQDLDAVKTAKKLFQEQQAKHVENFQEQQAKHVAQDAQNAKELQ